MCKCFWVASPHNIVIVDIRFLPFYSFLCRGVGSERDLEREDLCRHLARLHKTHKPVERSQVGYSMPFQMPSRPPSSFLIKPSSKLPEVPLGSASMPLLLLPTLLLSPHHLDAIISEPLYEAPFGKFAPSSKRGEFSIPSRSISRAICRPEIAAVPSCCGNDGSLDVSGLVPPHPT